MDAIGLLCKNSMSDCLPIAMTEIRHTHVQCLVNFIECRNYCKFWGIGFSYEEICWEVHVTTFPYINRLVEYSFFFLSMKRWLLYLRRRIILSLSCLQLNLYVIYIGFLSCNLLQPHRKAITTCTLSIEYVECSRLRKLTTASAVVRWTMLIASQNQANTCFSRNPTNKTRSGGQKETDLFRKLKEKRTTRYVRVISLCSWSHAVAIRMEVNGYGN